MVTPSPIHAQNAYCLENLFLIISVKNSAVSNPSSAAICLHGQAVKTSPSHGENWGSSPHGGAIALQSKDWSVFLSIFD